DAAGQAANDAPLVLEGLGLVQVQLKGENTDLQGLPLTGAACRRAEKRGSRLAARRGGRRLHRGLLGQTRRDLLHDVGLDDVGDLDVVEAIDADAALEAVLDLRGIVLEAL